MQRRSIKILLLFLCLAVVLFSFTDLRSKLNNLPNKLKRFYLFDPIKPDTQYQYELAVAAIFQNEAPYLKEWIEFHKLVGVQHFYLFNNISTDDYLSVLAPYMAKGEVDLIQWPYEKTSCEHWLHIQCSSYEHAIQMAAGKAKWLAILDIDEFLFPTVGDHLGTFLKEYEKYGGVGVNWQLFGTSGIAQIPKDKLLIGTLLLKAPEQYHENLNMKSIVRPEAVASCPSPHFVIYKLGYYQVNANQEPFQGPFPPYVAVDKIRVNHYWSRDEAFFYATKVKRRAGFNEAANQAEQRVHNLNIVPDHAILRFVPQLQLAMEEPS